MTVDLLVGVCLGYVVLMFIVAFAADRAALRGRVRWLDSPVVYTLSLSVYCSAWTFFGAVGYATRSGLEFATIYLGPTVIFCGAWWGLRRLVRVARMHHVTSVADLVSARFGKSNPLAALVTLIGVMAATPYIALQLQSVSLSFRAFTVEPDSASQGGTALWVASGLALFTILFGTRNLAADERHHGVVTAIAVEAVVKLVALLAVGIFVVWGLAGGPADVFARIEASQVAEWELQPGRWAGLIFLAAAAVLCLPRMFQVTVVENVNERHLGTASWAFPLYLLAMSLFVVPIAVIGLQLMPAGSNPDLFVLTLPLSQGQGGLAMLAFLGGFSSATSMVIVASIALATMVFGLSTTLWVSILSLIVLGAADMVSVYVRSSLIQLHTPDSMRGRVSSVSLLFVSASNELGEFRAGTMASYLGPIVATVGGGALALIVTILWARLFPALRDADRLDVPNNLKS